MLERLISFISPRTRIQSAIRRGKRVDVEGNKDGYLERFIVRIARKLTEESELEDIEKFYDDVMGTYEDDQKYDAKIVLGDFIAKVEKEDRIIVVASTSENGNRPVLFAQMYQLIIMNTKLQHKKIHKGTWVIPETNDVNQKDHV